MSARLLLLLAASCWLPPACAAGETRPPVVRIGYFHGGRSNMIYRAHQGGFFDREGVSVKLYTRFLRGEDLVEVPRSHEEFLRLEREGASKGPLGKMTGIQIVDLMLEGRFDAGTIGESSFLHCAGRGDPITAVALLGYDPADAPGHALMVRRGVEIGSPEDFKGKTFVSRRAGPGDHIFLREFLKAEGVPREDVKILDQVPDDRNVPMLERGEADAGFYHLLSVIRIVRHDIGYVYRPMNWVNPEMSQALLVFRKDFVDEHPEAVRRTVRGYVNRIRFEAGLPEDRVERRQDKGLMMRLTFHGMSIPRYDPVPLVRPDLLEAMQELLREYGFMERAVRVRDFIDNSFVESAGPWRPDTAEALGREGLALHRAGEHRGAAAAFRKALQLKPTSYWLHVELARNLSLAGETEEAARVYARAREVGRGEALLYVEQGYAHLDTGEGDEAGRAFQRALALDPEDASAHHHAGVYYREQGRYRKAEAHLRKALAVMDAGPAPRPAELVHTLYHLVVVLSRQRKAADTILVGGRALDVWGDPPRAVMWDDFSTHVFWALTLHHMAEAHALRGDYEAAESLLTRAAATARREPDRLREAGAVVAAGMAGLHARQGRRAEVEASARKALELRGKGLGKGHDPFLLRNLAKAYARVKSYDRAESLYKRVIADKENLRFGPRLIRSTNDLAELYLEQGRYRDAEAMCRKGLAAPGVSPTHPHAARAMHGLGRARQAQGDAAEAEDLYRKALAVYDLFPELGEAARVRESLASLVQDRGR